MIAVLLAALDGEAHGVCECRQGARVSTWNFMLQTCGAQSWGAYVVLLPVWGFENWHQGTVRGRVWGAVAAHSEDVLLFLLLACLFGS